MRTREHPLVIAAVTECVCRFVLVCARCIATATMETWIIAEAAAPIALILSLVVLHGLGLESYKTIVEDQDSDRC